MVVNNILIILIVLTINIISISFSTKAHLIGISNNENFGFIHPFIGLDHSLIMLAVGIWSTQRSYKKLWLLPSIFPLMMCEKLNFL